MQFLLYRFALLFCVRLSLVEGLYAPWEGVSRREGENRQSKMENIKNNSRWHILHFSFSGFQFPKQYIHHEILNFLRESK
jgi:hypothetical protein